ncbi:hypothetical protein GCM10009854_22600 [Saccharopolyspora halophila]|uniref:PPE family domain-containing protein n=1 Tax=Saccharopolyspora halophila TaxID=405551 RepID=A0ABP5T4J4_9PSEU
MTERNLPPASFEGAQLAQMREWVQKGGGSEVRYNAASMWDAEDKLLRGLKGELEEKLKQAGAVMQSKSGDAMQNQALPVVLWAEVTADQAKLQSEQMTAQGEAFKRVQDSIPGEGEEQAVPDDSALEEGWDNFWTGSTDAEDAKAHNEKLRQDAVQAFNTYQESSQSNVSGSAVFQKPPEIAVHNPEASGSAPPSVGGVQQPASTSSSSAGSAGTASGAGLVAGSGAGSGGYAGSGSAPAGTGSAWANVPGNGSGAGNGGSGNAGRTGAPGTPGYGGTAGRPGMPGAGRPGAGAGSGGARGAGSGAGRGVGAGGGAGRAGGPGMGAGGRAGAGGLGGASGSTAAGGAAGGAGGRGGAGMGGAGARGSGQQGEEDAEHETPDYLVGDQGVFDEDLPRVAPPVFGE